MYILKHKTCTIQSTHIQWNLSNTINIYSETCLIRSTGTINPVKTLKKKNVHAKFYTKHL